MTPSSPKGEGERRQVALNQHRQGGGGHHLPLHGHNVNLRSSFVGLPLVSLQYGGQNRFVNFLLLGMFKHIELWTVLSRVKQILKHPRVGMENVVFYDILFVIGGKLGTWKKLYNF